MNITGLDQARGTLRHLDAFPHRNQVPEVANQLMDLLERFPALVTDPQAAESLSHLTEVIYSLKERLPDETQRKVTHLFLTVHHIKPTPLKGLLDSDQPASSLIAQHKEIEALMSGEQAYAVPMALLAAEKTPCNLYFRSLLVVLGDGKEVKVSQGLLAHFSSRVRENPAENLVLEGIDRHQFDTLMAYLETGKTPLVHEDNALSLLSTALYLQIPALVNACEPYLNDAMIVSLLNRVEDDKSRAYLETKLSERFRKALVQQPVSADFLTLYKEQLKRPIRLDLSGAAITDEALKLLRGLLLQELKLYNCPKLTPSSLSALEPNLKGLELGGNAWVNDAVLARMPPHIETLSISCCLNVTKQGLALLTHVRSLDVSGCRQLKDEDLAKLPDQFERLDLAMCDGVGEKVLQRLGDMARLRHLSLLCTPVSDHSLQYLPKQLVTLNVSGCPLSDAAVESISQLMELQELSLSSLPIKGKALSSLTESLVRLHLDDCGQLTKEAILPLATRKKLRFLGLYRCPKITGEALQPFSQTQIRIGWQQEQPSRLAFRAFSSQ